MPKQEKTYFQFPRKEMRAFLPDTYNKVLEVGCGAGNFRSNLTRPHEYWGIEQDTKAAQTADLALDKVVVGNYESVSEKLPEHYFDLIICNDVVEHMQHHITFLTEIKQKLCSGGCLVISIPNVRYLPNLAELLFKRDWRYREAGILDSTHLRFFTEKSLRRVLEETGWKITKMSGINRYGSHRIGHKLALSYLAQLCFGSDCAYMQFGASLTADQINTSTKPVHT